MEVFPRNDFRNNRDKELATKLLCFSRRVVSKHFFLNVKCQNLTLDLGHVVTEIGHVTYQSMRLDEENTMSSSAFYLFSIGVVGKKKL